VEIKRRYQNGMVKQKKQPAETKSRCKTKEGKCGEGKCGDKKMKKNLKR